MFDEAITSYHRAIVLRPDYAEAYYNLANITSDLDKFDDAIAFYRRAVEIRPGYTKANYNLAVSLLEKGEIDDAIDTFHRTLEIDPGYVEGYNGLGAALTNKGMLKEALDSFHRALIAAQAGAAEVIACEVSKPIAEAAQQIVRDNGYLEKIKVIKKKSTQLIVGSDLREPANVFIFEIFDAGLIGEGVMPSLRHALQNLVTPDVRLIPQAASVYGMLIETSQLHSWNPISSVCGFDLSAFDRFRNSHTYGKNHLREEDYKCLTGPFFVKKFEFDKIPAYIPNINPQKITLAEVAIADGTAHAITYWFDLHLDADTTVSNRPGGKRTHWAQAVQFFESGKHVQKGEQIQLTMTNSDIQILFFL